MACKARVLYKNKHNQVIQTLLSYTVDLLVRDHAKCKDLVVVQEHRRGDLLQRGFRPMSLSVENLGYDMSTLSLKILFIHWVA